MQKIKEGELCPVDNLISLTKKQRDVFRLEGGRTLNGSDFAAKEREENNYWLKILRGDKTKCPSRKFVGTALSRMWRFSTYLSHIL